MKETLKSILRPLVFRMRSVREHLRDGSRFRQACTMFGPAQRQEQWIARLTIDYHRLEKGLSVPEPRLGFGKDVLDRLLRNTPAYIARYGHDEITNIVRNVLAAYAAHNAAGDAPVERVETYIAAYDAARHGAAHARGGTLALSAADIHARAGVSDSRDPEAFFMARHSVRQFADRLVDQALLESAARIAGKAPSVCNRQSGRVYTTTDPTIIAQALKYQNGNRGFGHAVPCLGVVCADLDIFEKLDERNQGFIDGGLFAMSFVYGLHALGLGSCMLNWSVATAHDARFRAAFGIPDSQLVISMVAIGHLKDSFPVAESPRRPVTDILHPLTPR